MHQFIILKKRKKKNENQSVVRSDRRIFDDSERFPLTLSYI